jgi:hypothetical protein
VKFRFNIEYVSVDVKQLGKVSDPISGRLLQKAAGLVSELHG